MEQQTYQDAVLKTVMWWSEKAFSTPMNQNNGDDSSNGSMAFILMNMLADKVQSEVTPDKIAKFESKLTELLMKEGEDRRFTIHLGVDYNPDRLLAEACEYAGVNSHCLPCKTTSWIDKDNKVTVSYQYRGQLTEI